MSLWIRIKKEIKSIFLVTLYFLAWFGALTGLKILLLHEYHLNGLNTSMVLLGALITAKAVVILEHVPLFESKKMPAIVSILLRTLLYLAGVIIILVLERAFEARHEYGSFLNALSNLGHQADHYRIIVNTICVFGALFFYNMGTVINLHLGEKGIWKVLRAPIPEED